MTEIVKKNIEIINTDLPKARWNLSAMFSHKELVLNFVRLLIEKYNVNPIEQVHDSVNCKWSGGRLSDNNFLTEKKLFEIFNQYRSLGVNIFFIFSNHLISWFDLRDRYCNMILDVLNSLEGENGVIISSDALSKHIRKKYPKLKQISSIIKVVEEDGKGKLDFYKNLQKRFDRVVIHVDDNKNFELLDNLDRSKIEILVNEPCRRNCAFRKKHYDICARIQKEKNIAQAMNELDILNARCKALEDLKDKCFVAQEHLNQLYGMGFRYFKLQGRMDHKETFLFNIVNYIINENYQSQFIRMMQG